MEECGYVVDVGPIGFAEGLDGRREAERQRETEREGRRKKKEEEEEEEAGGR